MVRSLGPLVPTSPIIVEAPELAFAPFEVNNAKQPALAKVGAVGPVNIGLPQPVGK